MKKSFKKILMFLSLLQCYGCETITISVLCSNTQSVSQPPSNVLPTPQKFIVVPQVQPKTEDKKTEQKRVTLKPPLPPEKRTTESVSTYIKDLIKWGNCGWGLISEENCK